MILLKGSFWWAVCLAIGAGVCVQQHRVLFYVLAMMSFIHLLIACYDVDHPKPVTDEEIGTLAHQKWEEAGRPDGQDVRFWLESETELRRSGNRPVS